VQKQSEQADYLPQAVFLRTEASQQAGNVESPKENSLWSLVPAAPSPLAANVIGRLPRQQVTVEPDGVKNKLNDLHETSRELLSRSAFADHVDSKPYGLLQDPRAQVLPELENEEQGRSDMGTSLAIKVKEGKKIRHACTDLSGLWRDHLEGAVYMEAERLQRWDI